jgi:tetratricopeptide (TPR) repeat protein
MELNSAKLVGRQLSPDGRPKEFLSDGWMALLLANVTFLIFSPCLRSDFVYDAREEILREGFVTSLANLPAVLSLKVVGMNVVLQDRPGQLLYMMLDAGIWGKNPFGYHLGSNLLHAANVGLLFLFLRHLTAVELVGPAGNKGLRVQVAVVIASLLFALHPIVVETVSGISYCSDLLVAFFTLLALLAATRFRPDNPRTALLWGSAGTLCVFATALCKESGLTTWLLLTVYWYLFRRKEPKGSWILFLGTAMVVTTIFLVVLRTASTHPETSLVSRIHFAPTSQDYLGGSFWHVFLIQPSLWVFMMGKLAWPTQLSADYMLENVSGLTLPLALAILISVVALQAWLGCKSRIGSLGVAMYWLGLVTVSNFMPLYCPLADRFYYLPLAGVALQLLALLLMAAKSRWGFPLVTVAFLAILAPLTQLNVIRQLVFDNEFYLWSDTVRVSPYSYRAQNNLGTVLIRNGQTTKAALLFQKALQLRPDFSVPRFNLGVLMMRAGRMTQAIAEFKKILKVEPGYTNVRYHLGVALAKNGQTDDAIDEFKKVVKDEPDDIDSHYQLGIAFSTKRQMEDVALQFRKVLQLDPNFVADAAGLGTALMQKGEVDDAIDKFREAVNVAPISLAATHTKLGLALLQKDTSQAAEQFQEALKLYPDDKVAGENLARLKRQPLPAGK